MISFAVQMPNWMASVDSEKLSSVRVQLLCFQEGLLLPKWAFFFLFPSCMPESASACNWTQEKHVCIATEKAIQMYSYIFSKSSHPHISCSISKLGGSLFASIRYVPVCLNKCFWPVSILLGTENHDSGY